MEAKQFYSGMDIGASLIQFVSKKAWEKKRFIQEKAMAQACGFEGKTGDIAYVSVSDGTLQTIYLGVGDDEIETALAIAAVKLPAGDYKLAQTVSNQAAMMWGAAQYRFDQYKKNTLKPRRLCLLPAQQSCILQQLEAIFLVRDLINTPAQVMHPQALEDVARSIAKTYHATCSVIQGEALLKKGYEAIYTVGRAASVPPRLIEIIWGASHLPRVTLVGKGVCFDSGGLNIKPASSMRFMKKDMAGAAHVLGLAQWIMAVALPIRLHVLIPAVENVIGAQAYHPGDIIKMKNGLTVEIENTDAEGRLILADALVAACAEKPTLLMDFATLTGAARVALGPDITVMFTPHHKLAQDLYEIGEKEHDPLWRLPLHAGYVSMIESPIADLLNCASSPYGGAIIAALFLEKFVTPTVEWVHFDMMAWNQTSKPGRVEGGEAMALRAAAHYLMKRFG